MKFRAVDIQDIRIRAHIGKPVYFNILITNPVDKEMNFKVDLNKDVEGKMKPENDGKIRFITSDDEMAHLERINAL
jgi:hypothetical protein